MKRYYIENLPIQINTNIFHWNEIRVLKFYQNTYLNTGRGNACDWHWRAKLCDLDLIYVLLVASWAKVGALAPIGSD